MFYVPMQKNCETDLQNFALNFLAIFDISTWDFVSGAA